MLDLDAEITTLDRQLKQLVAEAAPTTTARLAVSTGHAGALLVTAGQNVDRLRSEASFAACAAPARSRRRPDAPIDTASTTAVIVMPTARYT